MENSFQEQRRIFREEKSIEIIHLWDQKCMEHLGRPLEEWRTKTSGHSDRSQPRSSILCRTASKSWKREERQHIFSKDHPGAQCWHDNIYYLQIANGAMVNVSRSVVVKLVSKMFPLNLFLLLAVLAPVEHHAGPRFILSHPWHNHGLSYVIPLSDVNLKSNPNLTSATVFLSRCLQKSHFPMVMRMFPANRNHAGCRQWRKPQHRITFWQDYFSSHAPVFQFCFSWRRREIERGSQSNLRAKKRSWFTTGRLRQMLFTVKAQSLAWIILSLSG